jgi:hypothetical protein
MHGIFQVEKDAWGICCKEYSTHQGGEAWLYGHSSVHRRGTYTNLRTLIVSRKLIKSLNGIKQRVTLSALLISCCISFIPFLFHVSVCLLAGLLENCHIPKPPDIYAHCLGTRIFSSITMRLLLQPGIPTWVCHY